MKKAFKWLVFMMIVSIVSCKDNNENTILSSVEISVSIDEHYNFLAIENTTVSIRNLKTELEDSTLVSSGNKVVFDQLPSGDYIIQAYRQLTREEKITYFDNADIDAYIAGSQNIKIGKIQTASIQIILQPNLVFIPSEVRKINKFIHDYMNYAYFWNKEIPNINHVFEQDSKDYFYKLLKNPDDKWSFITDDLEALQNYFQGITKSKGYSIQPYYFKTGSNQVVVFVEYVYRDSPAQQAGLKRGDMFYKINGQVITDQNYQHLLALDNMVITFGQVSSNGEIIPLSPEIEINAIVMNSNPIVSTSITEIGSHRIGYIAYTGFRSNYDNDLINTFNNFKTTGVTELVLDLRYNGGGAVSSAMLLANLIAPVTSVGEVFIREKWNENLKNYDENLYIKAHELNLNLNRLFVLTTSGTASASEMIIYGLEPYMEIIKIGETTHGKYYGSVTISDPDKKHNWAIQPIVMRAENKNNSINYQAGLPPTFQMRDNVYNAQLGEPEEHFLEQAISKITTGSYKTATLKSATTPDISIAGFKEQSDPLRNTMTVELPLEKEK